MKNKRATGPDMCVPMGELTPLMTACLAQGQEVILTVTGNSMRPFLRHQRDQGVLTAVDGRALQPGDVPLYRRQNGQYVLHRVVERQDGDTCRRLGESPTPASENAADVRYTMLGDAQTAREPGVTPEQIIAAATAFYRRGRRWDCDSPAYRHKVLRWHRLLPIRRELIFLHRLPGAAVRRILRLFERG